MERLVKEIEFESEACTDIIDIDTAIDQLNKFKSHGCIAVRITYDGLSDSNSMVGIKYQTETDEEFQERVKRKEQAELVELARLKEKYENK